MWEPFANFQQNNQIFALSSQTASLALFITLEADFAIFLQSRVNFSSNMSKSKSLSCFILVLSEKWNASCLSCWFLSVGSKKNRTSQYEQDFDTSIENPVQDNSDAQDDHTQNAYYQYLEHFIDEIYEKRYFISRSQILVFLLLTTLTFRWTIILIDRIFNPSFWTAIFIV